MESNATVSIKRYCTNPKAEKQIGVVRNDPTIVQRNLLAIDLLDRYPATQRELSRCPASVQREAVLVLFRHILEGLREPLGALLVLQARRRRIAYRPLNKKFERGLFLLIFF